ncbi:MAG: cell division protein FtsB [Azoarcus sp.]|jgi:cell division protein FtsB|nr:cell division protein FtsB [Azoarcus sp.]
MRWPIAVLLVLVVALQYPLWLGRGGWLRVWDLERDLQTQRDKNLKLEERNAALDAEVGDLQSGTAAIEERARYDLGLVKPGEIFVQVPRRGPPLKGAAEKPKPAAQEEARQ